MNQNRIVYRNVGEKHHSDPKCSPRRYTNYRIVVSQEMFETLPLCQKAACLNAAYETTTEPTWEESN